MLHVLEVGVPTANLRAAGQEQGLPLQGGGCWDTPSRGTSALFLTRLPLGVPQSRPRKAPLLRGIAGVAVNEILLPDYSQDMALN